MNIIYYTIWLILPNDGGMKMMHQKGDLFLSANGALTGNKLAYLDSNKLASNFLDAYMPRLRKRYGEGMKTGIAKCSAGGTKTQEAKILAKIQADSGLARQRLATGILASNKKP